VIVRKVALVTNKLFEREIEQISFLYRMSSSFKGIVGASSNVLGKNKAFLELKYLL
jgi:hypothetical protein